MRYRTRSSNCTVSHCIKVINLAGKFHLLSAQLLSSQDSGLLPAGPVGPSTSPAFIRPSTPPAPASPTCWTLHQPRGNQGPGPEAKGPLSPSAVPLAQCLHPSLPHPHPSICLRLPDFLKSPEEELTFGKHLIQSHLEFIDTDLRILERGTQMQTMSGPDKRFKTLNSCRVRHQVH